MTPARKNRLLLISAMVLGVATATGLALNAFNQNLMFFFSPSDVHAGKAPSGKLFRLGGMVVDGSFERPGNDMLVRFELSDMQRAVAVEYSGILPDLFREGQGIVSRGRLRDDGVFVAEEVLAKHDENYMPPEVAEMMQASEAREQ